MRRHLLALAALVAVAALTILRPPIASGVERSSSPTDVAPPGADDWTCTPDGWLRLACAPSSH